MKDIIQQVEQGIIGRVANRMGDKYVDNLEVLLSHITGGNHLEIGTLYGGSAIAVALWKKKHNYSGIVLCIDPLDGYYRKQTGHGKDPSGVPIIPSTLFDNIKKFGVGDSVAVMQSYSQDIISLTDIKFSTAFIDGDHKGEAPFLDWLWFQEFVTDYMIFDNYDNIHQDVRNACHKAVSDKNWTGKPVGDITYVIERIK